MKTLKESLFDKDLVTKELPVESIVKKMDGKLIKRISVADLLDNINSILDAGEKYTDVQIRTEPINPWENMIVIIRKNIHVYFQSEELYRYVFLYGDKDKSKRYPMCSSIHVDGFGNKGNYWIDEGATIEYMGLNHWKQYIERITKYWGGSVDYVILPKKISEALKEIIKKSIEK